MTAICARRASAALLLVLVAACHKAPPSAGPAATAQAVAVPAELGGPRAGLSADQLQAFARGKTAFQRAYTPAEGLGPLYNQVACSSCHDQPALGGGSDMGHKVLVVFDPPHFEGTVGQLVLPGFQPAMPSDKAVRVYHRPPALFGLGLLEAIPEAVLRARCDGIHADPDGVNGHYNRAGEAAVGRFGLKGHAPTIRAFVGNALAAEMGITNPENRDPRLAADQDGVPDPEASTATMDDLVAFVRGLDPPRPLPAPAGGAALFASTGCAACHLPETGPGVAAYTDLCVHRMGADFDTGAKDLQAAGDEWRTTPLWGLRFRKAYFHDDRTADLADAVRRHGGEAASAAAKFGRLDAAQRDTLLAFLRSL